MPFWVVSSASHVLNQSFPLNPSRHTQGHINIMMDSTKAERWGHINVMIDSTKAERAPAAGVKGVRQDLERKEGLMRMNMMGKRPIP
ncbi:hypothetical protein T484DRAFT_1872047 [Baffinella frigidus]|nr:hypothetical protein T484DRAFT_1872047 [Cryptophyta sp. CCMP2293]